MHGTNASLEDVYRITPHYHCINRCARRDRLALKAESTPSICSCFGCSATPDRFAAIVIYVWEAKILPYAYHFQPRSLQDFVFRA